VADRSLAGVVPSSLSTGCCRLIDDGRHPELVERDRHVLGSGCAHPTKMGTGRTPTNSSRGSRRTCPRFACSVDIDKWLRKHHTTAPANHITAAQADSRKLVAASQQLVSTLQRSGADFLFLDLDIALMMATSALTAGADTQKKARRQRIARRAYDTILYLSQRLKMTRQKGRELKEKLAVVRRTLEELGERF